MSRLEPVDSRHYLVLTRWTSHILTDNLMNERMSLMFILLLVIDVLWDCSLQYAAGLHIIPYKAWIADEDVCAVIQCLYCYCYSFLLNKNESVWGHRVHTLRSSWYSLTVIAVWVSLLQSDDSDVMCTQAWTQPAELTVLLYSTMIHASFSTQVRLNSLLSMMETQQQEWHGLQAADSNLTDTLSHIWTVSLYRLSVLSKRFVTYWQLVHYMHLITDGKVKIQKRDGIKR